MQRFVDKMANVVMNYSDVETKVREATNDDTWGPHGSTMAQLAKYTFTYEHYPEVMAMLWKRMFEAKKNWRRTYKALLLLNYLILNGSERVVTSAREHVYDMKPLENYQFSDEQGKDQGINVRQKSKEIVGFLQDEDRLREARKTARTNRDKYVGISNDETKKSYSDRYSQEPRSKGTYYDEDARGPVHSTHSDEDEDSPEKDTSSSPLPEPEPSFSGFEKMNRDSPSTARKTGGQPSKLVDLGAAATFAQQSAPTQQGASGLAQQGLLFGDTPSQQPQKTSGGGDGFADFEAAFKGPPEESQAAGGGFGDFAGFQSVPAPQQPTQQPAQFADFGIFQSTPSTGMSQPLLAPQPTTGGSFLMPTPTAQEQPSLLDMSEPKPAEKVSTTASSTIWNAAGINIDMDNLLGPAKPKIASSTGRPSMNQLAQSSVSTTPSTSTNPSFSSGPTSFSGPNYNISTSPMPQQSRASMSGMGFQPGRMGMQPGMSAPLQPGMGMPRGMAMGPQPNMGMQGMGQPGMGMNYGGGASGYGNMGYMQPQQMTGFGGGMTNTQMNTGMQYQRPF
ncbi:clathrin interactor 1-like [Halichondria panicea]|uniref:clathrin interactor 1-like n=1 Tax=Halichondria panicea TaxID=6063 RepID=UPI00312B6848